MTKESLLNRLENIRAEVEANPDEFVYIRVMEELLNYIANEEIRNKVEEIPL